MKLNSLTMTEGLFPVKFLALKNLLLAGAFVLAFAVTLLVVTGSTNIRSLPTAHKLIGDTVVRVRWHDVLSLSWKKLKAVLSFDLTTVSPVTIKVLQAIANVLARW